MSLESHIVHLQQRAPRKPEYGAACNGCGVCCAFEPCPVGQVLSRRRSGRCVALEWNDEADRYQCGAVPAWSPSWYVRLKRAVVLRWIAAGMGCDSNLQAQMPGSTTMSNVVTPSNRGTPRKHGHD